MMSIFDFFGRKKQQPIDWHVRSQAVYNPEPWPVISVSARVQHWIAQLAQPQQAHASSRQTGAITPIPMSIMPQQATQRNTDEMRRLAYAAVKTIPHLNPTEVPAEVAQEPFPEPAAVVVSEFAPEATMIRPDLRPAEVPPMPMLPPPPPANPFQQLPQSDLPPEWLRKLRNDAFPLLRSQPSQPLMVVPGGDVLATMRRATDEEKTDVSDLPTVVSSDGVVRQKLAELPPAQPVPGAMAAAFEADAWLNDVPAPVLMELDANGLASDRIAWIGGVPPANVASMSYFAGPDEARAGLFADVPVVASVEENDGDGQPTALHERTIKKKQFEQAISGLLNQPKGA